MPFRTGHQEAIGNNSTVTFLGTEAPSDWGCGIEEGDQSVAVHFLANIEVNTTRSDWSVKRTAAYHAHAIAQYMDFTQLWPDPMPPQIMYGNDFLARVHFFRLTKPPLENELAYLKATARCLQQCWWALDYAVGSSNRPLYRRESRSGPLPVQPNMIHMGVTFEDQRTRLAAYLQDDLSEEAVDAMCRIASLCRARGNWFFFEKGVINHLTSPLTSRITNAEAIRRGIKHLIKAEYLAEGDEQYDFFLREKFVRKLYLTCLAVPVDHYKD